MVDIKKLNIKGYKLDTSLEYNDGTVCYDCEDDDDCFLEITAVGDKIVIIYYKDCQRTATAIAEAYQLIVERVANNFLKEV